MNDLDIARKVKLKHISEIAEKFGLSADEIEMYGKYKAKIPLNKINKKLFSNAYATFWSG